MPLVPGTIDSLARTAAVLRALLDGVPDAAATTPDAEGWSARDVVAHLLIINDLGLDRRLRLIVEQDEPFLSDVNEHESLAASGYRERPLAGLLADFAARRASTVEWMRGLGPAQLERGGNHEFAGRVSVCDVSHHLAMHDLMHIAQIANLIAAPRRRPRQHGRRRIRADSAEPLDSATLADAAHSTRERSCFGVPAFL